MGRILSGTAKTIYVVVLSVAFLLDAIVFVLLLLHATRTGDFGGFIVYVLFGTWIVPTIGHWLGMLLSAPFAIADSVRKRDTPSSSPFVSKSTDLGEITRLTVPGAELLAFGFVSGVLTSQVWDGIFYLRTDLPNPTIRFQQREVHDEHGVLAMQMPAWSNEVGGLSIDQLIPVDSVDWVRIDSQEKAPQGPLEAHKEILGLSRDPNVLTGHATIDGDDRFFIFVGNQGNPLTPVETWEQALRTLGVRIVE